MKRLTILFLKFIILTLFSLTAWGKEIVDVRISIPLSESEARLKDYYISTDGLDLKINQVVRVQRKVTVTPPGKKSIGEIIVEIGQVKIIGVSGKVAIARDFKLLDRADQPLTESIGIMLGDTVETDGSFIDKGSRKPSAVDDAALSPQSSPEGRLENPSAEVIVPIRELPGIH